MPAGGDTVTHVNIRFKIWPKVKWVTLAAREWAGVREREREGAAALVQRLQFAARAERAERRKGGNSAYTASLTKQIVIK